MCSEDVKTNIFTKHVSVFNKNSACSGSSFIIFNTYNCNQVLKYIYLLLGTAKYNNVTLKHF